MKEKGKKGERGDGRGESQRDYTFDNSPSKKKVDLWRQVSGCLRQHAQDLNSLESSLHHDVRTI